MRVVIYARFSSHNQKEQSIEGQLKICYDYAASNGHVVVGEYIDRAQTGTNDNRAAFQRMLADSDRHTFDGVLVYQLDRFARNRYDSAINKAKLKKNGVRVISARENISDDPSGILIEGVLESMAEYYSAELSQKIRRGMNLARIHDITKITGVFLEAIARIVEMEGLLKEKPGDERVLQAAKIMGFGDKWISRAWGVPEVDGKQRFYVDETEAAIVREIFERYAAGEKAAEIVRDLNNRKITTSKGKPFNQNSIGRILRNKRYIGTYIYQGQETPDGMPRIIEDDLFNRVQVILDKNKAAPARSRGKEEYLLTTKLFCGHCKEMMIGYSGTGKQKKPYHYYICKKARKKQCDKKIIKKEIIEDKVVEACAKLLTDENMAYLARQVALACNEGSDAAVVKALRKQVTDLDKVIENLWRDIKRRQIKDIKAGYERLDKYMAEKAELDEQLAVEESNRLILTEPQVFAFLDYVKSQYMRDVLNRRALINIFVWAIYLYDDHFTLILNAGNKNQQTLEIPLDEIEEGLDRAEENAEANPGSPMIASAPPKERAFAFLQMLFCCVFFQTSCASRGRFCDKMLLHVFAFAKEYAILEPE